MVQTISTALTNLDLRLGDEAGEEFVQEARGGHHPSHHTIVIAAAAPAWVNFLKTAVEFLYKDQHTSEH